MSVVPIRNLGVSKGKYKYLYKNGVQSVSWDNTGASFGSGYSRVGGAILNPTNMEIPVNLSYPQERSIATNSSIDLVGYTKLTMQYNDGTEMSIDITSINSGNIGISVIRSTAFTSLHFFVSSSKVGMDNNKLATNRADNISQCIITKVWLE